MTIGERVRARRRALDLTQEEVARRAGVSLNLVNRVERGQITDPHISTLRSLARGLGVSVEELVKEPALASGKVSAPPETGPPTGIDIRYIGEPEVMLEALHNSGIQASDSEAAIVSQYIRLHGAPLATTPLASDIGDVGYVMSSGAGEVIDQDRVMRLLAYVLETDIFTKVSSLAATLRGELAAEPPQAGRPEDSGEVVYRLWGEYVNRVIGRWEQKLAKLGGHFEEAEIEEFAADLEDLGAFMVKVGLEEKRQELERGLDTENTYGVTTSQAIVRLFDAADEGARRAEANERLQSVRDEIGPLAG